uniref:Uncharacterized protein n=1 Tax=Pipistrellus kuhlii TaxID=59472 RepID=A0A7J7WDA2_PIPKU|nr:hypothetical protein mPipKuh1_008087 [Pipistrellus kuhlii]
MGRTGSAFVPVNSVIPAGGCSGHVSVNRPEASSFHRGKRCSRTSSRVTPRHCTGRRIPGCLGSAPARTHSSHREVPCILNSRLPRDLRGRRAANGDSFSQALPPSLTLGISPTRDPLGSPGGGLPRGLHGGTHSPASRRLATPTQRASFSR